MSQLQFCKTDDALRPALMLRMKAILTETDSHNAAQFSETPWLWQYEKLPTGKADAFLVMEEEKIQGYYHVPYYSGKVKGQPFTFAMIQDVAVSADMRGQGVFRQLAEYANTELDQTAQVAYTFPNQRSIHTFLKYNGYRLLKTLEAFLLPMHTRKVIQAKKKLLGMEYLIGAAGDAWVKLKKVKKPEGFSVKALANATDELAAIYSRHAESWSTGITRDKHYLQWRFFDKPGKTYTTLVAETAGSLVASATFRADEILGSQALVLMDFAYAPDGELQLLALLQEVKRTPQAFFKNDPALVFVAGNNSLMAQLKRIGFFRIPAKLNPRPLNLLVRDISTGENLFEPADWHITLADWDVF
jgi:GNAT superfamily N-acetyltransferase